MIRITYILAFLCSVGVMAQTDFSQTGKASFYADKFEGNYTASGEKYSHKAFTAAHLTLPFNTMVKVTNASNGKSVVVRINDRGPFIKERIIDLSKSAALAIGLTDEEGVTNVIIEVTDEEAGNIPEAIKMPEQKEEKQEVKKEELEAIANSIDTKEVYSVSVKRMMGKSYGVQIGSYNESSNFVRNVEALNSKFGNNVFLVVTKVGEQINYKVIVGKFEDRKQADLFKKKMSKEFDGCFVVEM